MSGYYEGPREDMVINLSDAFCWTRMGDYSGQPARLVVKRKELERQANDGVFWWGFGEPPNRVGEVCRTICLLIDAGVTPRVRFSWSRAAERAAENQLDIFEQKDPPDARWVFRQFVPMCGQGEQKSIPKNVIMTRAVNQPPYFALVCRSTEPLEEKRLSHIDLRKVMNLRPDGQRVGQLANQQITAVLVPRDNPQARLKPFRVVFEAELVEPYCVDLLDPKELHKDHIRELDDVSVSGVVDRSLRFVKRVGEEC